MRQERTPAKRGQKCGTGENASHSSLPVDLTSQPVVALAGGVGGAKLAAGLQETLPPGALTVIVNTGDDFEHWGLTICPDIDTVLYGLAGVNNPQTGWGRAGETWNVLAEMERLGGESWFRLGDKDLALHLLRNRWLKSGATLTEVTDRLRRTLDVPSRILPMCDEPVRTLVHTDEGDLPFQDYFVRRRCEPTFRGLTFVGADKATLSPEVAESLQAAAQIIICPSNPYLSVDPILSVPGLSDLVRASGAPVVAVSPIVGGRAVKGPAAKMMREMGHLNHLPLTLVEHYAGLLDGFVIDQQDRAEESRFPLPTLATDTIMTDLPSKRRLAAEVLHFTQSLQSGDCTANAPRHENGE